jgi:hypothetical protein
LQAVFGSGCVSSAHYKLLSFTHACTCTRFLPNPCMPHMDIYGPKAHTPSILWPWSVQGGAHRRLCTLLQGIMTLGSWATGAPRAAQRLWRCCLTLSRRWCGTVPQPHHHPSRTAPHPRHQRRQVGASRAQRAAAHASHSIVQMHACMGIKSLSTTHIVYQSETITLDNHTGIVVITK